MTINKISIFGNHSQQSLIENLLVMFFKMNDDKVLKFKTALLLDDNGYDLNEFEKLAVPFSDNKEKSGVAALYNKELQFLISYSTSNVCADFVAINEQQHIENVSFELMTTGEMGRIFVDNKKNISMESVTIAAAALYAGGLTLAEIIDGFNLILK